MASKRKETMTKQEHCWVSSQKTKKSFKATFSGKQIKQMTKKWTKKTRKMKH